MNKNLMEALEVRFDSDAGENLTVREYFRVLLSTVWEEGEGFSGKRPFGNSGWEYDLYAPLIRGGFIPGRLDEDGFVELVDEKIGRQFVHQLILAAFGEGGVQDLEEDDEEHPLWGINEQIKGLLEGVGASEDHEDVIRFLLNTGLPRSTVDRVHKAIVWGDTKVRLSVEQRNALLEPRPSPLKD